jgi:peptide deformylase
MTKEILKYPNQRLYILSGLVREFDDSLFQVLEDLKETINANGIQALSGPQVGISQRIVVFKDANGEFVEMINPGLFSQLNRIIAEESCESVPNLTIKTKRFNDIKIIYQDRTGEQKYYNASGELAILLQRKIDIVFGALIIDKIPPKQKSNYDTANNIEVFDMCPTHSYRDTILDGVKYSTVALFVMTIMKLFTNALSDYFLPLSVFAGVVLVVYFIYAQIETRRYKNCTSCQTANSIGNLIGYSVFISLLNLIHLFL